MRSEGHVWGSARLAARTRTGRARHSITLPVDGRSVDDTGHVATHATRAVVEHSRPRPVTVWRCRNAPLLLKFSPRTSVSDVRTTSTLSPTTGRGPEAPPQLSPTSTSSTSRRRGVTRRWHIRYSSVVDLSTFGPCRGRSYEDSLMALLAAGHSLPQWSPMPGPSTHDPTRQSTIGSAEGPGRRAPASRRGPTNARARSGPVRRVGTPVSAAHKVRPGERR
jgi:hypothetical protein